MLVPKCIVCLETLGDLVQHPFAAPCGHIYCRNCLTTMSRIRQITNCALCRSPFSIDSAVRLYLEHIHSVPKETLPLDTGHVAAIRATVHACDEVTEETHEKQVFEIIKSTENVVSGLCQKYGDTEVKDTLNTLVDSLDGLRKRLKLYHRINSLQQEVSTLSMERDSLRGAATAKAKLVETAVQAQTTMDMRLRGFDLELKASHEREKERNRLANAQLENLKTELQKQRARSAKFEKKYYSIVQELKVLKLIENYAALKETVLIPPQTGNTDPDESLEILPSTERG